MARIFTVDFYFQHQHYTALVTACPVIKGSARYIIAPNDDKLKSLLPDGKISFNNLSDLQHLAESQPRLRGLLHSMASGLYQKLEPTSE